MFDPVAELRLDVKELAAEDRAGWPAAAHTDRLCGLLKVRERFEVEIIRTVAAWDGVQAWALDGGLTPVSWLLARFPITRTDARTLVDLAGLYRRHPQIAAALDGAEITLVHLRHLARAEKHRETAFALCVDALVEAARRKGTIEEFAGFIDDWIDLVDDRPPPDDTKRAWRAHKGYGGLGWGELNSTDENLALIRSVLDLHDTPDPDDCPEGPRTKAQRDHDTFMDLFRWLLANRLDGDIDPPAAPTSSSTRRRPPSSSTTPTASTSTPPTPSPNSSPPTATTTTPTTTTAASAATATGATRPAASAGSPPARRPPSPSRPPCCAPGGSAGSSSTPTPAPC